MLAKINSQEDQDAFDDALNATYGFEVSARRWDNTNWVGLKAYRFSFFSLYLGTC